MEHSQDTLIHNTQHYTRNTTHAHTHTRTHTHSHTHTHKHTNTNAHTHTHTQTHSLIHTTHKTNVPTDLIATLETVVLTGLFPGRVSLPFAIATAASSGGSGGASTSRARHRVPIYGMPSLIRATIEPAVDTLRWYRLSRRCCRPFLPPSHSVTVAFFSTAATPTPPCVLFLVFRLSPHW